MFKYTESDFQSRWIAASALILLNGMAWGLGAIPYALYIDSLGELPITTGGIEAKFV